MDENETQVQEVPEAAADEWDDMDLSDLTDDSSADEAPETEPGETEAADQPAAEQAPEDRAAETQGAPARPETGQTFTLKHLDEVRTVGRDEVIALAQKGMDYDRIRGKLEERTQADAADREAVALVRELAERSGMKLEEFMDSAIAAQRCSPDRSDYETVLSQVKLERRERELQAREARIQETQRREQESQQSAARRQADVQSFLHSFPGVKADSIPREVWTEVSKGKSLTEAYAIHEAARLRTELEAERQNAKNAARSAGSRSTAGASQQDAFDRLWYEDE